MMVRVNIFVLSTLFEHYPQLKIDFGTTPLIVNPLLILPLVHISSTSSIHTLLTFFRSHTTLEKNPLEFRAQRCNSPCCSRSRVCGPHTARVLGCGLGMWVCISTYQGCKSLHKFTVTGTS